MKIGVENLWIRSLKLQASTGQYKGNDRNNKIYIVFLYWILILNYLIGVDDAVFENVR